MTEKDSHRHRIPAPRVSARGLWALWFVVASLVALVALHAYLGQRATDVQRRIADVLLEADDLGSRLSLARARQMVRLERYLLSGDRSSREAYVSGIAEEDSVFAHLSDLVTDLDLEVRERLAELRLETTAWHIGNQDFFDQDSIGGALASSRRDYLELERATVELDRAIQGEVAEGRRDLARERTLQTRLTIALALLALGAAFVVGRVGWRFRDLNAASETRRREAVRARREIDALLEATGDGVLGIDLDGKCTSLNRAGVELLGYTEREIKGRDVHDTLFHSNSDGSAAQRAESPVLSALTAGAALDSTDGAVLWRRRGRRFPAHWSLRPLVDGVELRGAVLTFTDMTEIQEKEEALKRAVGQREDVVSIVSHDLRNPLGVVLAASDLLLELPLDEDERRRQAEIIGRSGKRMQRLIEDLLDVARIEAGAFVVHPSLEELRPILEEACEVFAHQADQKGIRIRIDGGPGEPRARVDRDRILQALANLLDNALRLTPAGGEIVLGAAERNGYVDITVRDDGPGIEATMLEDLFDRFSQSGTGSGGGAGLGLAIVKGVAESHGGEVSVASQPGAGSTFTVSVPRG